MAVRPMDLQIILQISSSVEKMQMFHQQYSQRQQEQLALYMQRNFQVRQHKTEAASTGGETRMEKTSEDGRKKEQQKRKKKEKKKLGGNIDVFV